MSHNMEELLDLGSFDKERTIPGTRKSGNREYLYLSSPKGKSFDALFRKVVRFVTPPLMKGGGVGTEGCKIELPNGEIFQAISYKEDLDGWRKQITQGALANNVKIAQIEGEKIKLESGKAFLLNECHIEFS